jgi:hypothetical protein
MRVSNQESGLTHAAFLILYKCQQLRINPQTIFSNNLL